MSNAVTKLAQQGVGEKEAVDIMVEEAVRLTGSVIGYFAMMNWNEDQLTMWGWSRSAMAECSAIHKPIVYKLTETGLWGDCVRYRSPVITNDYAASSSPNKKGYPKGHVEVIRHMNVPVWEGEKIRGVLGVGNKNTPYSDEDAQKLQNFGNQAWDHLKRIFKL